MLNDFWEHHDFRKCRVYVVCGYTDLRLGIDGLASLVESQFQMDPFRSNLFLFCGRRSDRIKALYWEGDGFVLLYKRQENGKFQWPKNDTVLPADETTLQVLHEPGKPTQSKSCMWLYRTSGDTDKPIVLYEYTPDKKAENPRQFLAGFSGYLHTDGNKSCRTLEDAVAVAGCMAHARRKFITALDNIPKGKQKNSAAGKALAFIGKLYDIEDSIREKTEEERYRVRQEQSKPVFEALSAWVKNLYLRQVLPGRSIVLSDG